ncbi:MAG: TetR/AcrR family transcriptional regulator [Lachnospiraceae bacterium]|nr:TetR/AcrR family transcriptional regulator [Lachnospiraceae bacterium]MDD3617194.1 TetR/AcrR family transcriptional regulator [Lachnospiraceae bacterium]
MDLRAKRTRQNIINAFIQLRGQKPLEKITVKELSELAMINKATFYLHFQDIYDLSNMLEDEMIASALKDMPTPTELIENPGIGTASLIKAVALQGQLFQTLFSGNREHIFVQKMELAFKELIWREYPELKENAAYDIAYTLLIYGAYHAYLNHHKEYGMQMLTEVLSGASTGVFNQLHMSEKEQNIL